MINAIKNRARKGIARAALCTILTGSVLGCSLASDVFEEYERFKQKVELELIFEEIDKVRTPVNFSAQNPLDIVTWVYQNISQTDEEPYAERWQAPQETLDFGKGDCEDLALLSMALSNSELGIKPNFIEIRRRRYSPVGYDLHAVIEHNGEYYDAVSGKEFDFSKKIMFPGGIVVGWEPYKELTYDSVFWKLSKYIQQERNGVPVWYD